MQDRLTITVGEKETELFMSYSKLMKIVAIISEFDGNIALIYTDPDVVERALSVFFGKNEADADLSLEDGEKFTSWVGEHLLDFFTKAAEKVDGARKVLDAKAAQLTPSSVGTSP